MSTKLMDMIFCKRTLIALGVSAIASPLVLIADVPNPFADGDVIYAEDMNANFEDLDGRIGTYEGAIFVDEDGNVGIGTTSPAFQLDVESTVSDTILMVGSSVTPNGATIAGELYLKQTGGTSKYGLAGDVPGQLTMVGQANDTTYVSGQVKSVITTGGNLARSSHVADLVFSTKPSGSGGIREAMRITGGGNVGIGTTTPSTKLHVAGTITEDSDARLKRDIEPVPDALGRLMEIEGVTFNWIDANRGKGTQMGVIAQDVEAQFPELVFTDANGFKSVNYSGLVAPLIEAVKEQQGTIVTQGEMIGQQGETIMKLEARLVRLEALISTKDQ